VSAEAIRLPWRTGRRVGRTIYAQQGPEPSDSDPLIGVMDTPELAALAVAARNGHDDPVQQLRDIADHDIGGNNPNLADVLLGFASILERNMTHPVAPVILVLAADVRRAVDAARGQGAFPGGLVNALDRLSDAAERASR